MGSSVFWARMLFAVLFFIVTFLTLTPNPEDADAGFAVTRWIASLILGNPELADKVAHFLAYGALGASAHWAQIFVFGRRWSAPVMLAVYGVLLEGLQGIGGVRAPELADAAANSLGAIAGFGGALVLSNYVQQRQA